MAARFTENSGDPAWLKSQRVAQARANTHTGPKVYRAMPYPTQTPSVVTPSTQQFVVGAKSNEGASFVLGALAGYLLRGRR